MILKNDLKNILMIWKDIIEKIHLNILNPYEFSNYYTSAIFIYNILKNIKLQFLLKINDKIERYEKILANDFKHYCNLQFDIDIMSKYSIK